MVGEGPATVMELVVPAGADVTPRQNMTDQELKDLARDRLLSALFNCSLADCESALPCCENAKPRSNIFTTLVWRRGVPEGVGPSVRGECARRRY